MQGHRYPNPIFNKRGSGSLILPTLKDFLLPIYVPEKVKYQKSYFLQKARTLCDLGFFAEHCHLSDDALILEIVCLSIDCDGCPERLFLEGNYLEMLEVDTERILCCSSLEDWKRTLDRKETLEDDLDVLSLLCDDDEDDLLLDEDCEEILEKDTLLDEDCEEILEEDTLPNEDCQKTPEYSFDTLLESLGKLSKISRAKFVPENIVEVDNNCIRFDLEGKTHNLMLNGLPYEPSVLALQINSIISETGYQFEVFDRDSDERRYCRDVYVILLSEKEKQNLANKTGDIFDYFWMFPTLYISLEMLYGDPGPDYSFEILSETLVNW